MDRECHGKTDTQRHTDGDQHVGQAAQHDAVRGQLPVALGLHHRQHQRPAPLHGAVLQYLCSGHTWWRGGRDYGSLSMARDRHQKRNADHGTNQYCSYLDNYLRRNSLTTNRRQISTTHPMCHMVFFLAAWARSKFTFRRDSNASTHICAGKFQQTST